MDYKNQLLLASAARLYSLGVDLEGAREVLRRYVESGLDWHSSKMDEAYKNYTQLKDQFDSLEAQYLSLRDHEDP